uniref:GLPGLI family protein n=1 Tax=Flavobacterium sp. TaxID=239 RepID=UPI00404A22B6
MKKFLCLSFLLFTFIIYSQVKNTEVSYTFVLVKDNDNASKKSSFLQKEEDDISKISHNVKPKLVFNDTIAIFYSEDILEKNEEFKYKLARIYCRCDNPIFYNKKEDKVYYNFSELPFLEEQYTVYENLTKQWVLTNETKKIDQYTCYKATAVVEEFRGNDGSDFKNITAWYCPELPYAYGPIGYGGLPGLILELQREELYYAMESIKIKSSELPIKTIPLKKVVSSKEFYKKLDEALENRKKK